MTTRSPTVIRVTNVGEGRAEEPTVVQAEELVDSGGDGDMRDPMVFSLAGPLEVSVSPRYYLRQDVNVIDFTMSINSPGSTDTIVDVYFNGEIGVDEETAESTSFTFADGDEVIYGTILVELIRDFDYVQVGVSEVGTGAEDLSVQLEFEYVEPYEDM